MDLKWRNHSHFKKMQIFRIVDNLTKIQYGYLSNIN